MGFFLPKLRKATIKLSDYKLAVKDARKGDVCYFDPPYAPLNQKSNFTQYTANGFGFEEQVELADTAEELCHAGVTVLISNHDTPFTRKIYGSAKIIRFDVQRNISCDGKKRKKAKELMALFKAR